MEINPCFISYRHPGNPDADKYVQNFVRQLNKHLTRRLPNKKAFFDQERLGAGDFYKAELASQLCKSACMVICFSSCHFDVTHPFCALEYKAMLELERQRLPHLNGLGNKGLIITVVFTGDDYLPAEIKDTQHCINFENIVVHEKDFEKKRECQKQIGELAKRIEQRYVSTCKSLVNGLSLGCNNFAFHAVDAIMPWIDSVAPVPKMPGY